MNFYCLAFLLSVIIIFAYTLGFWSLHASGVGFKTYRNPALGFSIDYPTHWIIWEDRISNQNVTFMMPPKSESLTLYDAPFIIHTREAIPYLDTDTMTLLVEGLVYPAFAQSSDDNYLLPVVFVHTPIWAEKDTILPTIEIKVLDQTAEEDVLEAAGGDRKEGL